MTDKKTAKTEKQTEKKQPTELKDQQLDEVQGGKGDATVFKGEVVGLEPFYRSGGESKS